MLTVAFACGFLSHKTSVISEVCGEADMLYMMGYPDGSIIKILSGWKEKAVEWHAAVEPSLV